MSGFADSSRLYVGMTIGGAPILSEENEILRVLELQRITIRMLEKLLADYKEFYHAEKDRADIATDRSLRLLSPRIIAFTSWG